MATQQEVIKAFMKSLDLTTLYGEAILDEAIKACSPFNSMQYVINKMVADCKNAKSADNFLKTYCGINLDNDDTGAITGLDAGGSVIKTAESIVPESGSLKNFKKNSFKVNGLTIKLGGGRTFSDLNDSEKFIWQGLYTWWAKGALDLIAESYGDNFSFTNKSSATVKKLEFNFYTSEDGHAGAETGAHYSSNKAESLSMKVDLRFFSSLINNADNPNGKSDVSSTYLDRLLAHEFTHAVMFANLDYSTEDSLPEFIIEGVPELTQGCDGNDMLTLAGDSTLLRKTLNSEKDTNPYGGGFMFLRYLARQAGDLTIKNTTSKTTVQSFYGNDSLRNEDADSVKMFGGNGNDDLSNNGGNKITLVGGAGNDLLWNQPNDGGADAQRVSMNGGEGDDSITNFGNHAILIGGSGNDTVSNYKYGFRNGELIFGDVGKNVKIYGGKGEDVINNFGANVKIDSGDDNDTIRNEFGDNTSIVTGAGNNYVYNRSFYTKILCGDGKDTVENYNGAWASINTGNGNDSIRNINASDADSHYVTIESGAGDDTIHNHQGNFALINGGKGNDSIYDGSWYSTLFGGAGNDSITTDGDSVTVDAGAGNDYIINHGKSVSLFGGNGDDIIRNYVENVTVDGGKGADTLIGGKSNDNLRGGSGNDSLSGGNGKDTLSGGTGDDKLLGGARNDSINGGAGKDSLWGGKGNDTLFGGDGKDVILGFDNSDTLTFDNLDFTSSYSKKTKSVLLKFDNGSVTFKNFSATTFHINNATYKISGSKFKLGN